MTRMRRSWSKSREGGGGGRGGRSGKTRGKG